MPSDRSDSLRQGQGTSPRVIFVRTDRLGETLLNLPALHAIRTAWPHCRLTLVVRPALRELFIGHPDVTEVVVEPTAQGRWWFQAWRLGKLWRSWEAQIIIISNSKKGYHLAAWLAGIPYRVGYDRKWGWLLTHHLSDLKALGDRHEVEYNLDLVKTLGVETPFTPSFHLPVRKEDESSVLQLFEKLGVGSGRMLIAMHPWTSNPKKQWPLERMRALIQRLRGRTDIQLAVIGGPEERANVSTVMSDGEGVVDLVGRLSLRELAAFLRTVRVLVSNDSGPMHLAAAVGTPVVALFGTADPGSHPRRWGPWGTGHTVIHKPLDAIAVDDVLHAVTSYLHR